MANLVGIANGFGPYVLLVIMGWFPDSTQGPSIDVVKGTFAFGWPMTPALQAREALLNQYSCSLIDIINEEVHVVEPFPVLIQEILIDRVSLNRLA